MADADAIWPLTQAFATSFTPERAAFDRAIAELATRDDTFLAIGTTASGAVGYLLATAHLTLFANAPVVWVEEVMVREVERRSGVGRQLMDAAEAWAVELGAAYISLATRRASDFYLALGYEESATFFRKSLGKLADSRD
ncbi:MAG: GNAT family N-acetyltransferase [Pseudolysinimonas sp.]